MLKRRAVASSSVVLTALVVLSLLALVSIAGASNEFSDVDEPVSPEMRFHAARTAAQAGNADWAMQEYAKLVLEEPNNVDYLFGYGQVLFWSEQTGHAIRILEQARKLAPDYEDVWRLEYRARIAVSREQPDVSLRQFQQLAVKQFPDADWHRQPIESAPKKYRWQFDASREYLDNDAPDWERLDFFFGRQVAKRGLATLSASRVSRFATTDTQFGANGSFGFGENWTMAGGLLLSSAPNFLPETAVDLGVGRRFGHGWVGGVRWRRRDYESTPVNSFGITTERYFGGYRIAYSLDRSELSSEQALAHALTVNHYTDAGSQFGLVLAVGEEIELVSPGQLLKTDVDSAAVFGNHPVNEYLNVGWRLATHRQGQFYRRNAIGLSISGGF